MIVAEASGELLPGIKGISTLMQIQDFVQDLAYNALLPGGQCDADDRDPDPIECSSQQHAFTPAS